VFESQTSRLFGDQANLKTASRAQRHGQDDRDSGLKDCDEPDEELEDDDCEELEDDELEELVDDGSEDELADDEELASLAGTECDTPLFFERSCHIAFTKIALTRSKSRTDSGCLLARPPRTSMPSVKGSGSTGLPLRETGADA
jgi:hypothetical protein